jgi:hypothetical protein
MMTDKGEVWPKQSEATIRQFSGVPGGPMPGNVNYVIMERSDLLTLIRTLTQGDVIASAVARHFAQELQDDEILSVTIRENGTMYAGRDRIGEQMEAEEWLAFLDGAWEVLPGMLNAAREGGLG